MPRRAASASHLPGHPGVEEKGRGEEARPLWLALLLEPLRLRLDRNLRGGGSPTRQRSYRARGRYARQLANLYRHFARERVLVLRQTDLLDDHDGALRSVFAFLGVDPDIGVPPARVGQRQLFLSPRCLIAGCYRSSADREGPLPGGRWGLCRPRACERHSEGDARSPRRSAARRPRGPR